MNIEQQIRAEQKAYQERVAALRKKQRQEDEKVDAEVVRHLKKAQPEQWAAWREEAAQRLEARKAKRSEAAKAAKAPQQPEQPQRMEHPPVPQHLPEHMR